MQWGKVLHERISEVLESLKSENLTHESCHVFSVAGRNFAIFITDKEGEGPNMDLPINREHQDIMRKNYQDEIPTNTAYSFDVQQSM